MNARTLTRPDTVPLDRLLASVCPQVEPDDVSLAEGDQVPDPALAHGAEPDHQKPHRRTTAPFQYETST